MTVKLAAIVAELGYTQATLAEFVRIEARRTDKVLA
jgi:hypothetical protein